MPNNNKFANVSNPSMFSGLSGTGRATSFVNSGFSVNALRPFHGQELGGGLVANALLRKDEWKELDEALVDVARNQLNGIADLRVNGLVYQLGGLGTVISEYEQLGDMTDADVNMTGASSGLRDTPTFSLVGVPVPIVHRDFTVDLRRLEASRRMGNAIDVTAVQIATRKVADKLEDILFNGITMVVDGNSLYGYKTHPSVNTGSVSTFATIGNIYTGISAMASAIRSDGYYGNKIAYVHENQYGEMLNVYTDGSGQSALERCVAGIPDLMAVKPSQALSDGEVVMATMQRDVVDLALAQDVTVVEWSTEGGMIGHYKVMTAQVPRVKSDSSGNCGVAYYTGA